MQTIQAQDITLYDLRSQFNLQYVENAQFFSEWQIVPEVSDSEKKALNRIKSNYLNLIEYSPMLENTVKMVVLSPLLDLAGFYQRPFRISTERQVEIFVEDRETKIKGKIDVLGLQEQLWILIIESKKAQFSLEPGIPQALSSMIASPNTEKPCFGLVTNGNNFIFIKLLKQEHLQYSLSDEFTLRRTGDLNNVLSILKKLGTLVNDDS